MASIPPIEMPEELLPDLAAQIPEKMFFRVGEVSRLVGVPAYVLRFWETEFSALSPKKSGRGHRLYRRKDVALFLQIKELLYVKRFTIEGARNSLKTKTKPAARKAPKAPAQTSMFPSVSGGLEEIRTGLAEILDLLK
jgi:DNA-binding transcriptional MerR regulator